MTQYKTSMFGKIAICAMVFLPNFVFAAAAAAAPTPSSVPKFMQIHTDPNTAIHELSDQVNFDLNSTNVRDGLIAYLAEEEHRENGDSKVITRFKNNWQAFVQQELTPAGQSGSQFRDDLVKATENFIKEQEKAIVQKRDEMKALLKKMADEIAKKEKDIEQKKDVLAQFSSLPVNEALPGANGVSAVSSE